MVSSEKARPQSKFADALHGLEKAKGPDQIHRQATHPGGEGCKSPWVHLPLNCTYSRDARQENGRWCEMQEKTRQEQLDDFKTEYAGLLQQIERMNGRKSALEKIIAGFEEYDKYEAADSRKTQQLTLDETPARVSEPPLFQKQSENGESFKGKVFSLIQGLEGRRGVNKQKLILRGRAIGLDEQTEASTFESAITYALAALKRDGTIRQGSKRGTYRVAIPK